MYISLSASECMGICQDKSSCHDVTHFCKIGEPQASEQQAKQFLVNMSGCSQFLAFVCGLSHWLRCTFHLYTSPILMRCLHLMAHTVGRTMLSDSTSDLGMS